MAEYPHTLKFIGQNSNGAFVSTSSVVFLIPGILLLLKVPPLTFETPSYCLHDLYNGAWAVQIITQDFSYLF